MSGWQPGMRAPNDEDGFSSVLVTGLVAVLVATALAVTWLGSALEASHRAAAAADLAGLAAAQAHQVGDDPCGTASATAALNDARLVACRLDGDVVEVAVEAAVRVAAGVRVVPSVTRRARAGPEESTPAR